MNTITTADIAKLKSINSPSDIKTIEYSFFTDDHLHCAECVINGIPIELMWYDECGFVVYYAESPKAFDNLKYAIQHAISMIEDE